MEKTTKPRDRKTVDAELCRIAAIEGLSEDDADLLRSVARLLGPLVVADPRDPTTWVMWVATAPGSIGEAIGNAMGGRA